MFLNKLYKSCTNVFRCISMPAKFKHTSVCLKDGVGTITLCHLKTRNSLSMDMMACLIEEINCIQSNSDVRVLVINHEGPIFSSGHNLKELNKDVGKEQQKKVFSLATTLMNSIIDCPVPVIAQVNGVAAAAGCQLVAQCDLAICTKNSSFSTPGANFGIFCSTPGIALSRCVGRKSALYMLVTGLPIPAEEALRIGLVNKVADTDEKLDAELKIICDAIKNKSRSVIEKGKHFFYEQNTLQNIRDAYVKGADVMVNSCNSEPGKHGIDCFISKNKPTWTE